MPVGLLSDDQVRAYAAFEELPSLNADLDPAALWTAVAAEAGATKEQVLAALEQVEELVPADDGAAEAALRAALADKYNTVRPFLRLLGESKSLSAAAGGRKVLAAVRRLPELARRQVSRKPLVPKEIDASLVSAAWKRPVFSGPGLAAGAVDRDAYVVCVLEALYRALQIRDVFASPSLRWADPCAHLLDGKAWEAISEDVLASLSLTDPVEAHLDAKILALDAAWKQMAGRLAEAGDDALVRVPRGAFLDRVPGRLRAPGRHLHPHARPAPIPGRTAHRRGLQRRHDSGDQGRG
jgi:hypothetical protein